MKKFNFTKKEKVLFYLRYAYYKLLVFKEVKKGKFPVIICETIWILNRIFNLRIKVPRVFLTDYIETIYGKFHITPDLLSTVTVSPSFERPDINLLMSKMKQEIIQRKKLLFIDIGANFGYYTIAIGNEFKRNKRLKILAFEPGSEYLSLPTDKLLKKNIYVNKLRNVKFYKIGIGSKKEVNKFGVKTAPLDSIIGKNFFKKFDKVFIKLDVDDVVVDALKGIEACVKYGNIVLLVEDFVDKKTISFLQKNNYHFLKKLSTYNSFWMRKNH